MDPFIQKVHADSRGEIYSITLPDGRELMLHHSVAGALRGGHSHNYDEVVLLLSGKMRYHRLIGGKDWIGQEIRAPLSVFNQAEQVHMGEFLEDSWLVEWKIGVKADEGRTTNYEPYRQLVTESILA